MGYIKHDAVIVATNDYRPGGLPDVEAFRQSLPEEWRRLVIGPVTAVANWTAFYAFLPDGSKEGWDTSDEGDTYREQFRALFQKTDYDDVVTTSFGGDYGSEVGARVETAN